MKAFKTALSPQGSLEGRATTSRLWCDWDKSLRKPFWKPQCSYSPFFPQVLWAGGRGQKGGRPVWRGGGGQWEPEKVPDVVGYIPSGPSADKSGMGEIQHIAPTPAMSPVGDSYASSPCGWGTLPVQRSPVWISSGAHISSHLWEGGFKLKLLTTWHSVWPLSSSSEPSM